MAITSTNSTNQPAPFSIGDGLKCQIKTYRALTGVTSGTITADGLKDMFMVLFDGQIQHSAAETFSGNVATVAVVVPGETTASRTIDGILYTAVADLGQDGNAITIQIVDGTGDTPAVADGSEVVTVSGNAIVIRVDPTAVTGSTRTHVKTAVLASAAASALVVPSTVTSGTTVAAVTAATALQNGVTGGARGTVLCLGR